MHEPNNTGKYKYTKSFHRCLTLFHIIFYKLRIPNNCLTRTYYCETILRILSDVLLKFTVQNYYITIRYIEQ